MQENLTDKQLSDRINIFLKDCTIEELLNIYEAAFPQQDVAFDENLDCFFVTKPN